MTQQPDKLFRQKLENYPIQASNRAWSRIESNLDRSSLKSFWWRIAASIVLIAAAGALIWNNVMTKSDTELATNIKVQQPPQSIQIQKPLEPTAPAVNEINSSKVEQVNVNQRVYSSNKKATSANQEGVITDMNDDKQEVMIATIDVPAVQIDETIESNSFTQAETGLYLVYTADEVNEKYLRKFSSAEATRTDKKSSRMQKLMAVANNLTDVETGIRDLRQFKDEIFALNFLERKNNN